MYLESLERAQAVELLRLGRSYRNFVWGRENRSTLPAAHLLTHFATVDATNGVLAEVVLEHLYPVCQVLFPLAIGRKRPKPSPGGPLDPLASLAMTVATHCPLGTA